MASSAQRTVRHRGRGAVLAVLALVATLLPVAATGQDLDAVEARLEAVEAEQAALQARLDEATQALAEAEEQEGLAEQRAVRLAEEAAALDARIAATDERTAQRLRSVYINGSLDPLVVLLSGSGATPGDEVERALAVELLVSSDRLDREAALVAEVELATTRDRLDRAVAAATAATADRESAVDALETDLASAVETAEELAAEKARLEEEARRAAEEAARRAAAEEAARRAAERASSSGGSGGGSAGGSRGGAGGGSSSPPPPPSSGGGLTCPVDSPRSFADTWGAPRSGGRSHRGTDIIAPRGNTVRAIVGGTWDVQRVGRNAGLWAILRGSDGNHYWYLHLESHRVGDGARVSRGQVVGTNGDTGNARGTTPHVHFELHVGGSSPVNPYRTLRRACG